MGRVDATDGIEAAMMPFASHHISTATYDAHSAPVPPPPRPPRPVKIPGYLLTAETTTEATQWIEQQVFYTQSRTILQSIRQKQPIFLLDAETQELHGVFQRAPDAQLLQQDLTSLPGPHGYQVHVVPMYEFAVTLELESVEDVLVRQLPSLDQQPGQQPASSSFEPMLGSFQHGALWEAFMKKAKRQKHMEAIQEEEQQQRKGVQPPPPPPRRAPAAAAAAARGAQAAANGHSEQ